MVLAARGTQVTEHDLVLRTQIVDGGVKIQELERLARTVGLIATAREATALQIRELLRDGGDVIAYVNRAVFDLVSLVDLGPALRAQVGHAVVPVHVTAKHVTFHDPHLRLSGIIRKTVRRFETAQRLMGLACLVISN